MSQLQEGRQLDGGQVKGLTDGEATWGPWGCVGPVWPVVLGRCGDLLLWQSPCWAPSQGQWALNSPWQWARPLTLALLSLGPGQA